MFMYKKIYAYDQYIFIKKKEKEKKLKILLECMLRSSKYIYEG